MTEMLAREADEDSSAHAFTSTSPDEGGSAVNQARAGRGAVGWGGLWVGVNIGG